jgi:hypothetical protein
MEERTVPLSEKERRGIERMEILDPEMVRMWQAKSPAERLAIANGMWRSARDMMRNLVRAEHPERSEDQVRRGVAERSSRGTR